jgi:hypothetical protein
MNSNLSSNKDTQFYGRHDKLDESSKDERLHMLRFRKIEGKAIFFLWTQHFDRRCVVTQLSSKAGIVV